MHVLLVEPYSTGSHRAWARAVASHGRHDVHVVELPGRFWKWRMHGAAVELASAIAEHVRAVGRPDVLLVSDMVDVASLLGIARRELAEVPVALYLHESQFDYPLSPRDRPDATYAMINWRSAMAADAVVFNSRYHRDVFLGGARRLLRAMPDRRQDHLVDEVAARSDIVGVGVELPPPRAAGPRPGPPVLLWNHRWEHDKDPETFANAVVALAREGLQFEVVICGEAPPTPPPAFERLPEELGDRLRHIGRLPGPAYRAMLTEADVVVSTARHEYYGIAVLEAVASGAFPVLPDRLVYPEHLADAPADVRAWALYPEGGVVDALRRVIAARDRLPELARALRPLVERHDVRRTTSELDAILERVAARRRRSEVPEGAP